MEQKKFTDPEIEMILLTEEDVITLSGDDIEMEEEEYIIPKNN